MENILNTLFYYVFIPLIVLGIAVNIHEFGHFIIAKMFGMRIEAYSFFGLGPRVWGFKRGHTDYRISAIPLGAYVKLYGDEATASLEGGKSEDLETFLDERNIGAAEEGKGAASHAVPLSELYELRPRWQKLLVMLGGPFMNLVLAVSIPFGTAMVQGIEAVPAPVIGAVKAGGPADAAGIKVGDRIVSFDGIDNPTWRNIEIDASVNAERPLPATIERSGQRSTIQITPRKEKIFAGQFAGLIDADPDMGALPVVVGEITPDTPAAEAGLVSGDHILAINGETVRDPQQTKELVDKYKSAPIRISVDRNGTPMTLSATVRKLEDGTERLGFSFKRINLPLEPATLSMAASYAINSNLEIIKTTGSVLGQVFSGKRSMKDSGIGGPIGIFQQSAEATRMMGIQGFFIILTGISLSLGVFNLLPIPMLDGGQIMVLAIEKVLSWFGRTLSMVAKERIQLTGLAIVLLLMVTVIFFDVSRLVGK
jgi:regulator of sigma E protease